MRFPALRRPSPSMAVSILALVIATSGTSVAAAGLIGSADVKNDSLKSADIKDNSLKGRDIKNGSLGGWELRDGSVKERDLSEDALAGVKGDAGPAGPAGPAGVGRWALVDATGTIISQSGGFTVTAAYPTLAPMGADTAGLRANGNVYINAGENLSNNGVLAVVALQNTVDQNGDAVTNGRAAGADANPEFSGEISAAVCQPGVVNCAPPNTGNSNHVVISPRNSDGSPTTADTRKRFYVVVTGDSTDKP